MVTLPCRVASLAPVPMAALNVFAGVMRFPLKTRTTSDAGNCEFVPMTPLRSLARSLMLASTALRSCTVPGWYPAAVVTPEESLTTALAALLVAFCACLTELARAPLFGRVAAYAAETLSSSSSAWLSLIVSALSCARCWTRPVACQLLTSP